MEPIQCGRQNVRSERIREIFDAAGRTGWRARDKSSAISLELMQYGRCRMAMRNQQQNYNLEGTEIPLKRGRISSGLFERERTHFGLMKFFIHQGKMSEFSLIFRP